MSRRPNRSDSIRDYRNGLGPHVLTSVNRFAEKIRKNPDRPDLELARRISSFGSPMALMFGGLALTESAVRAGSLVDEQRLDLVAEAGQNFLQACESDGLGQIAMQSGIYAAEIPTIIAQIDGSALDPTKTKRIVRNHLEVVRRAQQSRNQLLDDSRNDKESVNALRRISGFSGLVATVSTLRVTLDPNNYMTTLAPLSANMARRASSGHPIWNAQIHRVGEDRRLDPEPVLKILTKMMPGDMIGYSHPDIVMVSLSDIIRVVYDLPEDSSSSYLANRVMTDVERGIGVRKDRFASLERLSVVSGMVVGNNLD